MLFSYLLLNAKEKMISNQKISNSEHSPSYQTCIDYLFFNA